jgi:hypothetical protein
VVGQRGRPSLEKRLDRLKAVASSPACRARADADMALRSASASIADHICACDMAMYSADRKGNLSLCMSGIIISPHQFYLQL